MPYRFRRVRTRTAYALLAVNIVLYAMSVIHWIVNSVVILGVVSAGRAEDVIVTWFSYHQCTYGMLIATT